MGLLEATQPGFCAFWQRTYFISAKVRSRGQKALELYVNSAPSD